MRVQSTHRLRASASAASLLNERADKLLVNPRTVVPQSVCGVFRRRETFAFSDDRHEPPLGAFVLVDPDGYRTEAALAKWVKRGVDSVSTLPAKKQRSAYGAEAVA